MSRSSDVTRRTAIRVAVEVDAQPYPNGRFARLADPEGNPIQLWQPVGKDRGSQEL
jgi:glyoxylase I family protein